MAGNLAIAVAGAAMVRQLPSSMKWARLAGICMAGGYAANFPLIMSLMSGNFGGFTKKTTVNAMVSRILFASSYSGFKGSFFPTILNTLTGACASLRIELYGLLRWQHYWTAAVF